MKRILLGWLKRRFAAALGAPEPLDPEDFDCVWRAFFIVTALMSPRRRRARG